MKPSPNRKLALAALLLISGAAWSQAIYRSVDANGRVTYSDQPPAATSKQVDGTRADSASNSDAGQVRLPYVLLEAMGQFPVTLYTGPSCGGPCNEGRALLAGRGVPFAEKTVASQADIEALNRIAGDAALPLLTLGAQQLRGFLGSEWNQYLSAAGYPTSSQLPSGYRSAPAAPLAPPARVEPAPVPQAAPPAPLPRRSASNPAGIQF